MRAGFRGAGAMAYEVAGDAIEFKLHSLMRPGEGRVHNDLDRGDPPSTTRAA